MNLDASKSPCAFRLRSATPDPPGTAQPISPARELHRPGAGAQRGQSSAGRAEGAAPLPTSPGQLSPRPAACRRATRASPLPRHRHQARRWGLISIIISRRSSEKTVSGRRRPPRMLRLAGAPLPTNPATPEGASFLKAFEIPWAREATARHPGRRSHH